VCFLEVFGISFLRKFIDFIRYRFSIILPSKINGDKTMLAILTTTTIDPVRPPI